jgi:hypothetical protein
VCVRWLTNDRSRPFFQESPGLVGPVEVTGLGRRHDPTPGRRVRLPTLQPAPHLGNTSMKPLLEITFGTSSSPQYRRAVDLAQSIPGYQSSGEGRAIVHRLATSASLAEESTWANLTELLQMVAAWRSTKVTLGGQPVHYWTVATQVQQIRPVIPAEWNRGQAMIIVAAKADRATSLAISAAGSVEA